MKRLLICILLSASFLPALGATKADHKMITRYNRLTNSTAVFPLVSIHDVLYTKPESLAVADILQNSQPSRWTLQTSDDYYGDTVVVVGLVVAPFYTITYTAHGWTMLLADTTAPYDGNKGALIRLNPVDSSQAVLDGFKNPERGDLIMMTVRVEEFPTVSMNSTTQLRPLAGYSVDIIGSGTIPDPPVKQISDFYDGAYPGGTVDYSNGEPYEGMMVKIKNVSVVAIVNSARGTWDMVDDFGNHISDYDASYNFTFGHESSPPIVPDTSVTHFRLPPVGTVIDSIQGFITVASGGENPRGYRICPLYPGDVVYGVSKPSVTTHRRYPVIPSSTDSVEINVNVRRIPGGYDIGDVRLYTSLNNGPWSYKTMNLINPVDSTYSAYIIDNDGNPWPNGTSVRYYIKATDILNEKSQILANSSFSVSNDTTQGFFFFTVHDAPLSIYDVQYSPYPIGRSAYLGGDVALTGIVTADTTDIVLTPTGTFGTTTWYIQNGSGPYSGIWVVKRDSASGAALSLMKRGDSVTVYGSVQEDFDVTQILDSTVVIHATGRPLPTPATITTGTFNPTQGSSSLTCEPYESRLIKVVNATITDIAPVFAENWELAIDDGSGQMIFRLDGMNNYSTVPGDTLIGKKILHVGDRVDTAVGIAYFSHSRWKIVPRKDDDLAVGEPYQYATGWNMLSVGRNQIPASTGYDVSVLYPGTSLNAFDYSGGAYNLVSAVAHTHGYWLKVPSAKVIRQLGTKRTLDTVALAAGWNLVGALGDPIPVSTLDIQPGGNSLSVFYGYSGSYAVAETLKPSKGYWVKAAMDGYFVESSSGNIPKLSPSSVTMKEFNTLTVTDRAGRAQTLYFGEDAEGKILLRQYEMPPAAPGNEGFDVRYSSGRILEAYPASLKNGMEFGIDVAATYGPLTVSWNVANPQGKSFRLGDAENGKSMKSRAIEGQGDAIINATGTIRLNLGVQGGPAVPHEYSLSQNYPNPFNPSTKFTVALPQAAKLEIAVYNVLGQKVATLANDVRDAGYYTIVWNGVTDNGTQVASGIYFVKMISGDFNAVRKIMMMK